jgi:signal transduction histidine kinase
MGPVIDPIAAPPPAAREFIVRGALQFLHELLQVPPDAAPTLPELLSALARAFGARGAGLAEALDAAPVVRLHVQAEGQPASAAHCPWEEQRDLIDRVRQSAVAVAAQTADGASWLCTVLWPQGSNGWLLWLTADHSRAWSPGEAAALTLAGQTLTRLADLGGPRGPWQRAFERARLQRQLEGAAAVTSRLAHDFGNLLTGILGFAELSLGQLPNDSLPARYVHEVREAALRGAEWVRRLQLFARRRARTYWPASLLPTLREEEARLLPLWGSRVALRLEVPPALPPVALDSESLRQALGQLLDNAAEAIVGTGTVTVAARAVVLTAADCVDLFGAARPGAHLEVTVTDTGTGLSAEAQRRVLQEPFFSTKPQHRGLGLAIVYGLLQTAQGGFRLEPAAGGTVARLFLPVGQQPQAAGAAASPRGPRLLVVDDDPMVIRLVATALEMAGYRVEAAASGAEALALFTAATEPYQLVLSDVVMPQMTGFDLARQLLDQRPDVNLLFISSDPFVSRLRQDKTLRVFDLLVKPFRPEALLHAVRRSLESPRSFG